ncbi:hypothetical protein [Vibrio crassostreae]|uniref:hypothetical protein n=1 Tax=Vibrio crassostreae TaxID=246167 RepID=UPI001050F0CF|nr:hypothetical protein [Vibrio crassostreae]TCW20762.1 hypothetical protein EDB48_103101 [Vibrio crassostreae]
MMFKIINLLLTLSATVFWSTCSNAIEINSMFVVADKNGEGSFTIKNTTDKRIFMNVGMFEMNVVNSEIEKKAYNRDNILDWKINVRPAKTIIDPGYVKDFKVSMKCKNVCDDNQDQLFQLAFVPTPYFDDEFNEPKVVQMSIGFGALFLNAAKDTPIRYQALFDGQNVTIDNQGDSYLKARLTNCPEGIEREEKTNCEKTVNVLPGRKLNVELPKGMDKKYVDLHLKTNLDEYTEIVRLEVQ